jgi:predicted TIM-barrel fold metal-dependent hydrolase
MDECNVEAMVNFDGRWGDELEENLDRYDRAYPGRFATLCHLDWSSLDQPGGAETLAASLERAAKAGARGVKVWKDLGLEVRARGRLVEPDDPALDTIWEAAGALRLPVFMHIADPRAFFMPVDRRNERLQELLRYPQSSQAHLGPERFDRLISALEHMVASNPATTFVGVHVGCYAENLAWVSRMLDAYPNFHIDLAARGTELGRQPRAASALLRRHASRVLFGTDASPLEAKAYRHWFRLLETADEAFEASTGSDPGRSRWELSGLDLERDVLAQVYSGNVRRLLGDAIIQGEPPRAGVVEVGTASRASEVRAG